MFCWYSSYYECIVIRQLSNVHARRGFFGHHPIIELLRGPAAGAAPSWHQSSAVRTAVWPMLCYVSCALMHFALGNSPSSDLFRPTCSLASFQSTDKQTTTCCWHCYEERRPAYCTTSEILKYKTCKKLKFTK